MRLPENMRRNSDSRNTASIADDDERREADHQRAAFVGLAQVVPPRTRAVWRQDSVRLETSKVAAEEQFGQGIVHEDLDGLERSHVQVLLLEQAGQLAADPTIADRIRVRQDNRPRR